ncbi:MAG: transposase [Fischerella sp. CENA71]|nr:transposase [Fischerella sp. CENA71]
MTASLDPRLIPSQKERNCGDRIIHILIQQRRPENIIPLFQPPSAPELNPIERLWQFLKKPLKNQLFSSLQALRDRIQELFDQLTIDQVISISSYNFILEALFYAASY